MDSDERKVRIIELGRQGWAAYQIAREVQCTPSLVYYHLEHAGLRKRVGQRRKEAVRASDPLRDRVDDILASVEPNAEMIENLEFPEVSPPRLAPPTQPHGELAGFPNERTLDIIEADGTIAENLAWLRRLRADPTGTVADRLRATEMLLKWSSEQEKGDDARPLDDDALCTLLVDVLTALPTTLRTRVLQATVDQWGGSQRPATAPPPSSHPAPIQSPA